MRTNDDKVGDNVGATDGNRVGTALVGDRVGNGVVGEVDGIIDGAELVG